MTKQLENRIALITGASRGIGAAVAKRFAEEGATVVATARTVGGLEELDDAILTLSGKRATLVPMDLRQFDQIDNLGHALYERFGRVDIVVGNAGFLSELTPTWLMDPDSWSRMLDVNLTANARLIRSMDPLLRQSTAGRSIYITCDIGKNPKSYWSFYGATKAALENLVTAYAQEIEQTSMRVNLLNPGPTATALRRKAFPGEDPSSLKAPEDVTESFVKLASASFDQNATCINAQ